MSERAPLMDDLAEIAVEDAELADAAADDPTSSRPLWRERLATMTAIGVGAIAGANARYLVGLWVAARWGSAFPWGTLLINLSGSFVLGFYLALVTERLTGRSTTRLLLATGFLGAYTTFSTFSYETVALVQHGALGPAVAYVAASLIGGLIAVFAGVVAAHAL
ncbi:MAG TPA: fluoride efflux transporter CrcB [Thermomicrobiales bacterium]|nr:fluoride efflux transporter CrcB [Thermomicrobiales bacterium]